MGLQEGETAMADEQLAAAGTEGRHRSNNLRCSVSTSKTHH